jgi:hypothetical protein
MRKRSPVLVGVIVAAAMVPSVRAQKPAAPQVARARASNWSVPRTPDDRPDLQGTWLSRTATPLERPKALEGRSSLTDEEVATLKARADQIFTNGGSDFASGDAVFLAALAGPEQFKSVTSTHGAVEMIEREFDRHTSLVIDPPDGHIPPLTAEGRRRRTALAAAAQRPDGAEDMDSAFRCIAWGTPRLGGRYGAGDLGYYQIVQTPGYIVLFMETGHDARIIPLDGRPHLPAALGQWTGDSRGHWEGDTLVVDTVDFSPKSNFMGAGEHLHLIERFTRVAADTIAYQMTFDDPTTWTRPWTAEMPLKQVDQQLYEYACHEGNFEMLTGTLRSAHAGEKQQ